MGCEPREAASWATRRLTSLVERRVAVANDAMFGGGRGTEAQVN